jgi:hypothetical protein
VAKVRALLLAGISLPLTGLAGDVPSEFSKAIRPVLRENCGGCHNPANPNNRIDFLKADSVKDVETRRGLWRDVAAQLRNRTGPPAGTRPGSFRHPIYVDGAALGPLRYGRNPGGGPTAASQTAELARRTHHHRGGGYRSRAVL